MYNYFMLIGWVLNDIELKEFEGGKKMVNLFLKVTRPFKNFDGQYESDSLNVSLWSFLAEAAVDKIKKGKKVAVKGRIAQRTIEHEDGTATNTFDLIGDKLMVLEDSDTQIEG